MAIEDKIDIMLNILVFICNVIIVYYIAWFAENIQKPIKNKKNDPSIMTTTICFNKLNNIDGKKLVINSKDIESEFVNIVNDNFWNLI